jgi:N-acetyl-gamma-glutamyl-phosphate reductase
MSQAHKIKAGIVGGTGYTGVELMRLLVRHPQIEISCVTSRADAGASVSAVYPHLHDLLDIDFIEPRVDVLAGCDVVFFATPHGIALEMTSALLDKGVRVIDLSPDFRLKNTASWEHWYGQKHTQPQLLKMLFMVCQRLIVKPLSKRLWWLVLVVTQPLYSSDFCRCWKPV